MIVYADLLFLIDGSMDFLTLFLCGKCTHRKTSLKRLLLGSAVGAFGSVLLLFLPSDGIITSGIGILFSCLMVLITFGKMGDTASFVRQCVLVWGCGALTGGILSILLSLGTPVYMETEHNRGFPTAFLVTAVICILLTRMFTHKAEIRTAEILIQCGNGSEKTTALVDSGNLLTDPLSGKPVILVSEAAIHKLYPVINDTNIGDDLKIRLIPSKSVGGEKLLYGIIPDAVTVNGKNADVVLVVEDVPEDHYGGCGALCAGCIIK